MRAARRCLFAVVLTLALGWTAAAAADDYGGLTRVHVSKKAGQQPVETRTPISGGTSDPSPAAEFVGDVLGSLFKGGPADRSPAKAEDSEETIAPAAGPPARFELGASRDAAWIYTSLRTSFKSDAAPTLGWSDRLVLKGSGEHIALRLSAPDHPGVSLGIEAGQFKNSWWNHAVTAGGLYASERVDVDCGWATLSGKVYPLGWMIFSAEVGAASYTVHTHADTNAPSFEYDGLSGERFIALLGLGAGLTTPRRFPLTASIEGVYDLPGSEDAKPPIETGFVRVSASLNYRF